MKFSLFNSPKAQQGVECTYERYLETTHSPRLLQLCNQIAAEQDPDRRGELKKQLPVVTWQAFFPDRRIAREAQPSGLYMLDIDHVDDPFRLYSDKIAARLKELHIVYVGKTASTHGIRIVAQCLPTLKTIADCQRWLAGNLKVDYDGVCKDWARCSFLVHDSYTYYIDNKAIWIDQPQEGMLYAVDERNTPLLPASTSPAPTGNTDQREGLFGAPSAYKGIPYDQIINQWFYLTGGQPTPGERNIRLYQLALRLRYITDFNEATMLRLMPSFGLPDNEMREIVRHALSTARGQNIPKDILETLQIIDKKSKIIGNDDEIPEVITSTDALPSLPPLFRQWAEIAPPDFKAAVVLCQLPILGALGSRLRAVYLDGKPHSPSFQVSLEAPQASGKSFIVSLVNYELAQMIASDEVNREKERAWNDKMAQIKLTKTKVTEKQREEIGDKPKGIVRFVPATISITKMLQRMDAAQGLHLFALSEEIDTVHKAFSRGFSNFSEALRVSFDNGLYGQDYASENSWSGNVKLFYNCLFSGTPKAMRRFYPDVEDGLVSRVLFVTLPDQFGKPLPVWGKFDDKQKKIVDRALENLNNVTLVADEVQPEHFMKLDWLNTALAAWIKSQQVEALQQNDRTRDIFCRRAAVVGFRAGMIAWFLWDEKNTPTIRRNVVNFATWVANSMLNQHLLRFQVESTGSNTNRWEDILEALPDEFSRSEAESLLASHNVGTPLKQVIYSWKLAGLIKDLESGRLRNGKPGIVRFKKTSST